MGVYLKAAHFKTLTNWSISLLANLLFFLSFGIFFRGRPFPETMGKVEVLVSGGRHERKQSAFALYSPEVVKTFWKSKDEKTAQDELSLVHEAARTDSGAVLSNRVYKSLSKNERRYLQGASASELDGVLQTYLTEHIKSRTEQKPACRRERA